MIIPKLTAKAYDKATLALADKEEHRKHLGASVIGDSCDRQIWYKFRWAFDGQEFEPRMLRLFRRGHREEPEFVRILAAIPGVTLYIAGEDGDDAVKQQLRISACDGHFGGTPDGVVHNLPDYPGEYALLEFKTMNQKKFDECKADGVMTAHFDYFVQMQLYMEYNELPRALFAAVNKNTDEIHWEIVEANQPIAEKYVTRAQRIVDATEPPQRISNSPGHWECKYCVYQKLCHFDDVPAINCRTCAFASPGPAGAWECSRGQPEIGTQKGCGEHIFDPRFFGGKVTYLDHGEDWIQVNDGVGVEIWGPRHTSSAKLLKTGFVPF